MGIHDLISGIFGRWRKRKRDDNDENCGESSSGNKRQKPSDDYVLTPQEKDKENKTRNVYYLGEELDATESRKVEYKAGGVLFSKDALISLIGKYGSAFLNAGGGKILAGVNDKGVVKGVDVTPEFLNSIRNKINEELQKFRPFVFQTLYNVKSYPVLQAGKKSFFSTGRTENLCIVEIEFSKGIDGELYENGNHHVYLRRDGGVQGPLKPLDIKNLVITQYNSMLKNRKVLKEKENEKKERMQTKGITYITISP